MIELEVMALEVRGDPHAPYGQSITSVVGVVVISMFLFVEEEEALDDDDIARTNEGGGGLLLGLLTTMGRMLGWRKEKADDSVDGDNDVKNDATSRAAAADRDIIVRLRELSRLNLSVLLLSLFLLFE